mmetsp:Transcript_18097/g.56163  ORF Transcript_18097/g.56163 Transcript_18097/m.56163 type:complete len:411 (+) Transcript_18097:161-1393(+)
MVAKSQRQPSTALAGRGCFRWRPVLRPLRATSHQCETAHGSTVHQPRNSVLFLCDKRLPCSDCLRDTECRVGIGVELPKGKSNVERKTGPGVVDGTKGLGIWLLKRPRCCGSFVQLLQEVHAQFRPRVAPRQVRHGRSAVSHALHAPLHVRRRHGGRPAPPLLAEHHDAPPRRRLRIDERERRRQVGRQALVRRVPQRHVQRRRPALHHMRWHRHLLRHAQVRPDADRRARRRVVGVAERAEVQLPVHDRLQAGFVFRRLHTRGGVLVRPFVVVDAQRGRDREPGAVERVLAAAGDVEDQGACGAEAAVVDGHRRGGGNPMQHAAAFVAPGVVRSRGLGGQHRALFLVVVLVLLFGSGIAEAHGGGCRHWIVMSVQLGGRSCCVSLFSCVFFKRARGGEPCGSSFGASPV